MKRTRWTRRLVGGVLALAPLGGGGCKNQLYLEPADYEAAKLSATWAKLESQPHSDVHPELGPSARPPATVLDTDRPARNISLKEAIARALEDGNVGGPPLNQAGFASDQRSQFTGRGASGTDRLAAFALDPALTAAEIERSLSKFDARWINSITWNKVDNPTLTLQQSFSNGDTANLTTTLAKPLPTGGVAGITFSTQYLSLSTPPTNPQFVTLATSYTPRLQFTFEQPLLQGFGVEINQLLQAHPGSALIPGLRPSGGQGTEGILITRIRADQQRAEFDRLVNTMLFNVEAAYWNLYSAYYNLAAQEEGLKQALEAFNFIEPRFRAGATREQTLRQAEAQYERFRAQVITARDQVLEAERQLRGLLGMRSDDGTRLVPTDEPTLVPYTPDWGDQLAEALRYTPELLVARQELKARQLDIVLQRNLRRPDVRFFSSYDIAGLGPRLDGDDSENALHNFITNQFNSWQLGLRADIPLGYRDQNALVRQAQLNMRKAYLHLTDSERKTEEFLARQYRQVFTAYQLLGARRAERLALARTLRLERQVREAGAFGGNDPSGAITFITSLGNIQQQLANAYALEFQAAASYNTALAGLEFAKGTSQRYNNVAVADGPLPPHVGKKAADHFREREAAIKVREHPADLPPLGPLAGYHPAPLPAPPAPGAAPAPPPAAPPSPNAPAPQPLRPEAAPMPKGPADRPAGPIAGPGGWSGTPLPQLSPADGPPAFTQTGTLTFPARKPAAPPAGGPVGTPTSR